MSPLTPTFTWTSEEARRTRKAWLRYTENGKRHRRSFWFLLFCASGGLIFGIEVLATTRVVFPGAVLSGASVALLLLLYCSRVKAPEVAQLGARIQWELLPDGLRVDAGGTVEELHWQSIRGVLRTPAGFWVWPNDAFERWLPRSAFSSPHEEEELASLVRSKVKGYAEIS